MYPLGWGLAVAGLGVHAWARRRDNELVESLAEDAAVRHEQVGRVQIAGFAVALALFVLLGRGSVALSVVLSGLGAWALGAALWRVQLPGPTELRRWLVVELLASWGLYVGVALVLWS